MKNLNWFKKECKSLDSAQDDNSNSEFNDEMPG